MKNINRRDHFSSGSRRGHTGRMCRGLSFAQSVGGGSAIFGL